MTTQTLTQTTSRTFEIVPTVNSSFITPKTVDPVPVNFNPFPQAVREQYDVDQCTFVTVNDSSLMDSIAKFVGAKGNKSFVIHKKNQSAIETQRYFNYGGDEEVEGPFQEDKNVSLTALSLGLGIHKYKFEETEINILYHTVGAPVGTASCVKTREVFVLFVEGKEKHEAIQKFVEHVIEWDEKTHHHTFNIYKYHAQYAYWSKLGVKIARPMSSVVLPSGVKSELMQDLEDFLAPDTFRWYKLHGIPYKRSYLLYGPPGSGKSSIIQAIAGHYKLNLCYIQPIDPQFTDDSFTEAIQKAPKKALVVLEDIDTYFGKDRKALNARCPLTFSGLLNGLDGVAAADGQIFILTTNFIDKLDSALIRTGRVDMKYEFPKVTADTAAEMFLQFYPDQVALAGKFKETIAQVLAEKDICMADLQQHFIAHRKSDAETAVQPSEVRQDVTGEQLKQITEKILKASEKKDDDEKNKESDGDSDDDKNSEKSLKKSKKGKNAEKKKGSGFGFNTLNGVLSCVVAGASIALVASVVRSH